MINRLVEGPHELHLPGAHGPGRGTWGGSGGRGSSGDLHCCRYGLCCVLHGRVWFKELGRHHGRHLWVEKTVHSYKAYH